jgi:hypothetical protein
MVIDETIARKFGIFSRSMVAHGENGLQPVVAELPRDLAAAL